MQTVSVARRPEADPDPYVILNVYWVG